MTTSPAKRPRLTSNGFAVMSLAAAIALSLFMLLIRLPSPAHSTVNFLYDYGWHDSANQRLAHRTLLASLLFFGLLSPWLRRVLGRRADWLVRSSIAAAALLRRPPAYVALLSVPVFYFAYSGVGRDQFLLGTSVFAILYLAGGNAARKPWVRFLCAAALALYAGIFMGPGFLGHFDFGGGLAAALMHYYALFGQTSVILQGQELFTKSLLFYGLLSQTALAMLQRLNGPFSFGDYVLAVQLFQVLFATIGIAALLLFQPRRPVSILFCVALWLPWISTCGGSMYGPTASGVRFLGYPISMLALLLCNKLPRFRQAFLLGGAAGIALLLNLETGICVTIGFAVYNCVSERAWHWRPVLARQGTLLAGVAVIFAVYCMAFRLGLGTWPTGSLQRMLDTIALFSSGQGGLRLYFDTLAVLLFVVPAYLLLRMTGVWQHRGLTPSMRIKFYACVVLLLWLAYFSNRPHHWNLWSASFLFSFLLVDLLPMPAGAVQHWRGWRHAFKARIPLMPLLIVFILGPHMFNDGLTEAKSVLRSTQQRLSLERLPHTKTLSSGIWLDPACAADLRGKIEYVRSLPPNTRMFFSSPDVFLIQLHTATLFPLPFQDLFLESVNRQSFEGNVQQLLRYAPDIMLLDAQPFCPGEDAPRKQFMNVLYDSVRPAYQPSGQEGGWLVLRRKHASTGPTHSGP